jgi:hypothetical protein
LVLGHGRWRGERCLGRNIGPHRLHHRFEDRNRNPAAGGAAAERAALAVGVIVAEPDRNRHLVGEAHEPGVVLAVGGASLTGNIRCEIGDGACGASAQTQHMLIREPGRCAELQARHRQNGEAVDARRVSIASASARWIASICPVRSFRERAAENSVIIQSLIARSPKRLVLAVPVAPTDNLAALRADTDDVVCLEDHEFFGAIGDYYRDFRHHLFTSK